ncbi:2-amino-4-hydroxy-6-hydroxymethyldihydropteridine diphosphokinase [Cutibacterium sp. WCA-380-WT-3A]|uniref:2-amino-4-hydroxy-6-hydroxymethyldihydropteridine diphosphokinase n=1 Tax=Cutibacterium porci TaxID=2605781 RepID=A0A7K0J4X1_9ACTN|nr:2-amino-4-hydroxy-6-hydroxymethyldihydropteridine diphosphokinase [Cutibacterium porci]MSS44962.1 2-amino-4-hydroxy-6-hydroxymethyldihydropteridine diphosphokinase [Cutibacterium porci]
MKTVFSLGSNVGNSFAHVCDAVRLIAETPGIDDVVVSPVYVTTPVGGVQQDDFLNLVVVATSDLPPSVLLERAHVIEEAHGRERTVVNGPRTLDVDLICVGDETLTTDELTLPHPRAHERAFVLVPWRDADPQAELPGYGRVADLLASFDADELADAVKPYPHRIDVAGVTVAEGLGGRSDEEDV